MRTEDRKLRTDNPPTEGRRVGLGGWDYFYRLKGGASAWALQTVEMEGAGRRGGVGRPSRWRGVFLFFFINDIGRRKEGGEKIRIKKIKHGWGWWWRKALNCDNYTLKSTLSYAYTTLHSVHTTYIYYSTLLLGKIVKYL